jgi:two-component system, chemotaxis family, sensor kinase Cph1
MEIKDIVNRDIVNLINCESEPIHIPGSIQPHGFLLGVKKADLRIEYCSANTAEYIQITPEQVLGKTIGEIFPAEQASSFTTYFSGPIDSAEPFVFVLNERYFNTTVHLSGETLILEFELFPDGAMNLPNLYNQTRKFVSIMERSTYLPELCQEIANETRAITGYDRVMIYRFDHEHNGEVIAESINERIASFAGQKYPHSDIPAQARELYIRNPLRMIADINYTPVPLLTIDDSTDKSNHSLDLSLSILRSVSPMHIEYMKNMGVRATLTISLLQNQKLWGLIACHHYSPKILPHYTRLSALLQGHFLTSQIAVREVAEEFEVSQAVDKALAESLTLLHENENFIQTHHGASSLMKLANATGLVIHYNGALYKSGLLPSDEALLPLLTFLSNNYASSTGFYTENLAQIYPNAHEISKYASGVIYHSMTSETPGGILWLRPEKIETINWAGNPEKAMLPNEDGFRLSPRKSFELWMEEVKNRSEQWRKSEINAASNFSYALQKHINFHLIRTQESKNRILNEELRLANRELANLNWISTHDLKEPLRKIQIFASKVLDREDPDLSAQVKDSVERMRIAAEKMQLLIEDIMTYSKTGTMERIFEKVNLSLVIADIVNELKDTIQEKQATITPVDLPVISAIPFQVRQLFINLLSNALKFTKPGTPPVVTITCEIVAGGQINSEPILAEKLFYKISIADNGIGFEVEYTERIFDVFQRLHPAHKYPGTGIGLAICKKIMESHGGFIDAEAELGAGAVFNVYFPLEQP